MKSFDEFLTEVKKKWDRCPECSPDSKSAMFHAEYEYASDNPTWQCQNCGHEKPRIIQKKSAGMSGQQQKIINIIKKNKKFKNVKTDFYDETKLLFITFNNEHDHALLRLHYHISVSYGGKIEWISADGIGSSDKSGVKVNRDLAHMDLGFKGRPKWASYANKGS